jgi:nitrogen regulatory protein PII
MKEIKALLQPFLLEKVLSELREIGRFVKSKENNKASSKGAVSLP